MARLDSLARLAFTVTLVAAPLTASAHIALTYPPPRGTDQKVGPCGAAGSVRGANVTVLEPGAMVTVPWNEPNNPPSHYRISFDNDGTDFTVPNDFMDFTQTTNVLVDRIADAAGGSYSQVVQLPSTPCENCTLQLFQMMYDKAPYGDGNDIYFQCADIALRVGGGPGPGPDAGGGGNPGTGADAGITDPGSESDNISGGCSTSSGSSSWIFTLLGVIGLAARRRRCRAV